MVYYHGTSTDEFRKFDGSGKVSFIIFNDDVGNEIDLSIDGVTLIGNIKAGEGIDFRYADVNTIYIRSTLAGNAAPFRLWFFGDVKDVYPEKKDGKVSDTQPNIPIAFRRRQ